MHLFILVVFVCVCGGGGGGGKCIQCECPYMWFTYVDGWMCACVNRFGYMWVYAY